MDVLNGDGGNNVFTGDNTQTNGSVGAGDQLNGGAGTDTFNYYSNGGVLPVPQLNSVEKVNLIGANAVTANFSSAVGLQQVTLKDTTVTGSSITLGAGVAAGLDNAKIDGSATFIGPAAQTAATLNVANGTNVTGVVDLQGAALTTLNVVSAAGAANTIGSLQSTTGTETTLNVSGAGDLTINAVDASLTTINASAATGKTSIDASLTTGNVAYTGGTGNDTIKFGATQLTAADVLDGGAGIDTLSILDTTAPYAVINAAKNFEVLGLGAAVTVDASQLTSLKAFSLDANAAQTISNMATGSTVAVTADHATAITLGGNTGVQDLGLTIGAAGKAGVTAGTITVAQNTIALSSLGDGLTGNVIDKLGNADNSVITVTGNNNLTITDALAGTAIGSKVDASALTGKLSVIGSAKNDILIGGSNDDTLGGGVGVNTLTGGAGKDTFVITDSAYGATKDVTTITDFVKGTDKLALNKAGSVVTLNKVAVTATTLDDALTAIALQATAETVAAWGVFGGNTYVVAGDAIAGLSAKDVVIKLAGTVDLGTTVGDVFVAA